MTASPHDALDQRLRIDLAALPADGAGEPPEQLLGLFDAMAASRHVDITARRLREQGRGYYTISSAGHESNAYVAAALRVDDPALLHYRSGGFYLARSAQAGRPLADGIRDILLGMFGAVTDPASGGRHKVFGNPALAVIPQTSTIASHLPRAVGVAFSIDRARRLGRAIRWPSDAIAITSFGDASLNHSTAVGALNTAGYCVTASLGMPLLFVCEDNGWGISVPTPPGWVEAAAQRPGIRYFAANGDEPVTAMATAAEAAEYVRDSRRPAFLHLRTVRFLAHAGTDVESAYRSAASINTDFERDPLLGLARHILANADVKPAELVERYDAISALVQDIAQEVMTQPTLTSARQVIEPLAPHSTTAIAEAARRQADHVVRERVFAGKLPENQGEMTLAQSINAALADALAAYPQMLVFGEDTGRKGGVYGVTRGLQHRFGAARVFDTLLDEQSILGLGLGAGVSGLLPVPEIQYLAYLHNAEDQLRGEAASLRFFSNGTYTNPMVVRVQGLAYQKGFGGHFHNDNALAVLRDIPGLVVAIPSSAAEAPGLLRTCLAAAVTDGTVSVIVEPIALYHERDAIRPGDRGWLAPYLSPATDAHIPIGRARVHGDGNELTVVTFGNGVRMSQRVIARTGISARVVDLRWINPLPVEDILQAAHATGRVLVVDETRHAGGVGEGIVTALVEHGFDGRIARVASADSYVPLGAAADTVLLGEGDIEMAVRSLV